VTYREYASSVGVIARMFEGLQLRGLWSRTDGDLLVNNSGQRVWMGADSFAALIQQNAPAEKLAVTTRATSLITGPLTAAPYQLVNDSTGETRPARWLADPMLLRADERMVGGLQSFAHARRLTRSKFWGTVLQSCIWYGYGAFIYQPDPLGVPIAGTMRQVLPGAITIDTQSRWVIGVGGEQVTFDRDGSLQLGPVEYRICVLRNPLSPVYEDGSSLGVFELSPSAFGLSASVDAYLTTTFRTGVPAGFLKVKQPGFNDAQAAKMKREWLEAHGNDERSIAVLNATSVEFEALSISPVDANAAGLKQLSIADVAYAFGLPPEVLGVAIGGGGTYQNITDQWSRLFTFGLSQWISEIEDQLTALVPWGWSVKVDLSEFEPDMTQQNKPAPPAPASEEDIVDADVDEDDQEDQAA
jgi:hypothetical protein